MKTKSRPLKMLHKALGDDPGHEFTRVVLPATTIEAQRER